MKDAVDSSSRDAEVQPPRYRAVESAQHYDAGVRGRGPLRRLSHRLELGALRRALASVDGAQVLDVPCGTGRIHALLADRFPTVVSMDSSNAMLLVHRAGHASGLPCQGDAFRLPFADGQFDWVVCYRLFHHLRSQEDRIALLRELARVAARGVVFYAWVDTFMNRRRGSRRSSVPHRELRAIIDASGLHMRNLHYTLWPFQPKAVAVCARDAAAPPLE